MRPALLLLSLLAAGFDAAVLPVESGALPSDNAPLQSEKAKGSRQLSDANSTEILVDNSGEDFRPHFAVRKCLVVICSAAQLIVLFYAFLNGMTGWEPLWVVFVECVAYCMSILQPGFGDLHLVNGELVAWLRFAGWLVTCPVLLMFLTAMTTYGGRQAAVRLVPLLIANQVMILAGMMASANQGLAKWLLYLLGCASGGMVYTLSVVCLLALLKVTSREQYFRWGRLSKELQASDALDLVADGAAAHHSVSARHEAARKLVTNRAAVLKDITRSDGPPTSQPKLVRLVGHESAVDCAMYEVARRLVGRFETERSRNSQPNSTAESLTWSQATKFLAARLQTSQAECARVPGHTNRKPDMSKEAGAAFREVLSEVGAEKVRKTRFGLLYKIGEREWAHGLTLLMSVCFMVGWFLFPVAWTLGPNGTAKVSLDTEGTLYSIGDLLAKNAFAACGVFIKHRYLQHIAPQQSSKTEKADGPSRPRLERRPSQMIYAEMAHKASAMANVVEPQHAQHAQYAQQGAVPQQNSLNGMVMHASCGLEPLCEKLYSGAKGCEPEEAERLLALCKAMIKLLPSPREAAKSRQKDWPQDIAETARTAEAMAEKAPLPLFVQEQRGPQDAAKGWGKRYGQETYATLINSPSANNSPAQSETMSPVDSDSDFESQSQGGTPKSAVSTSSTGMRKQQPLEMEPTVPSAPALLRARLARQEKTNGSRRNVTPGSPGAGDAVPDYQEMQRSRSAGQFAVSSQRRKDYPGDSSQC